MASLSRLRTILQNSNMNPHQITEVIEAITELGVYDKDAPEREVGTDKATGKTIYRKDLELTGVSVANATVQVAHGITGIAQVVRLEAIATDRDVLPIRGDATNLRFFVATTAASTTTLRVSVYYLKS